MRCEATTEAESDHGKHGQTWPTSRNKQGGIYILSRMEDGGLRIGSGATHPRVLPVMSSAWALRVSAMNSSLQASLGRYQRRPPGRTNGRSEDGTNGPKARFDRRGLFLRTKCSSSSSMTSCLQQNQTDGRKSAHTHGVFRRKGEKKKLRTMVDAGKKRRNIVEGLSTWCLLIVFWFLHFSPAAAKGFIFQTREREPSWAQRYK